MKEIKIMNPKLLREKSHKEQIERWANFVKNNPDK